MCLPSQELDSSRQVRTKLILTSGCLRETITSCSVFQECLNINHLFYIENKYKSLYFEIFLDFFKMDCRSVPYWWIYMNCFPKSSRKLSMLGIIIPIGIKYLIQIVTPIRLKQIIGYIRSRWIGKTGSSCFVGNGVVED